MKLIITSDWHLRESAPACRQDDFQSAQWGKVRFIAALQRELDCPVLHAGDLFDHWKPSPWLLSRAMQELPANFHTIYGNHDLPQHNLDLADKCGIFALQTAGKLTVLSGCHWGQKVDPERDGILFPQTKERVLIYHVMTFQGKPPYPGCTDPMAGAILRKYAKHYNLIITGHNHQSFTEEYNGSWLINPGGITRQESDEAGKEPCIYIFDTANKKPVTRVILPHEKGVVSKPENVRTIEERNDRIDAFVSRLQQDYDTTINYEQNLERFFTKNKTLNSVKQIILKSIE